MIIVPISGDAWRDFVSIELKHVGYLLGDRWCWERDRVLNEWGAKWAGGMDKAGYFRLGFRDEKSVTAFLLRWA
jgi:hypothetical protein